MPVFLRSAARNVPIAVMTHDRRRIPGNLLNVRTVLGQPDFGAVTIVLLDTLGRRHFLACCRSQFLLFLRSSVARPLLFAPDRSVAVLGVLRAGIKTAQAGMPVPLSASLRDPRASLRVPAIRKSGIFPPARPPVCVRVARFRYFRVEPTLPQSIQRPL